MRNRDMSERGEGRTGGFTEREREGPVFRISTAINSMHFAGCW